MATVGWVWEESSGGAIKTASVSRASATALDTSLSSCVKNMVSIATIEDRESNPIVRHANIINGGIQWPSSHLANTITSKWRRSANVVGVRYPTIIGRRIKCTPSWTVNRHRYQLWTNRTDNETSVIATTVKGIWKESLRSAGEITGSGATAPRITSPWSRRAISHQIIAESSFWTVSQENCIPLLTVVHAIRQGWKKFRLLGY